MTEPETTLALMLDLVTRVRPGEIIQRADDDTPCMCFRRIDTTTGQHLEAISAPDDIGLTVTAVLDDLCNSGRLRDGPASGSWAKVATA